MKTTEFLKKFSLVDTSFINDFYTFYDEGKDEYDYTINLNLIAKWLDVRKDNLKVLLQSNFTLNQDFIEFKPQGVKTIGKGSNNTKHVMLTYECAKQLCMISKSEKATLIRKYYIELEKLIIKYKDEINDSINRQLGIKVKNDKIIEENKDHGLIYILKSDEDTYKIGNTQELKRRMTQYNVGHKYELPIVFVFKTNRATEIEKCLKINLERYQAKNKTELYSVDLEFIRDTVKYCTKTDAIIVKKNTKLYNNTNDKYVIIIDREDLDVNSLYKKPKVYQKKTPVKKDSKKGSKPNSKKLSKTTSKANSKKASKPNSKKYSKTVSRTVSKKTSKTASKKTSKTASKKTSKTASKKTSKKSAKKSIKKVS
jgi:phage anti-repressor protein